MFEKICLILLLNLAFFFKTLTYKYASDDIPVYQNPPKTNNRWEKLLCWLDGRLRWNPQEDHALTTLIHALTAVFIFIGFGADNVSLLAALLFSFNPTNCQGSVWISGRAYALAAFAMTGAMAFPLFIGASFLLLATYTNPGFIAPLVFGASDHYLLLLALPLAWFVNGKRFKKNVSHKMQKEMLAEDKAIKLEKVVLALKTFGYYTTLALIPFKNTFYHSFLESASGCKKDRAYTWKCRFFFIGLIQAIAILAYWILVPWNMVSFGLLWWVFCLAPFCNFMRMSQEIAERYCYLPSVGLMFVLASLIIQWPVVIGIFLTMYVTRLWFLMDMYADDYYLLEYSCVLDPTSWFVWHARGMKRWDAKSYQEAFIIWTMARLLSPNEFKVNLNIATALAMSGHKDESVKFFEIAKKNIPEGQEPHVRELLERWQKGEMSIVL